MRALRAILAFVASIALEAVTVPESYDGRHVDFINKVEELQALAKQVLFASGTGGEEAFMLIVAAANTSQYPELISGMEVLSRSGVYGSSRFVAFEAPVAVAATLNKFPARATEQQVQVNHDALVVLTLGEWSETRSMREIRKSASQVGWILALQDLADSARKHAPKSQTLVVDVPILSTRDAFKHAVDAQEFCLVVFFGPDCPACEAFEPVLSALANAVNGKLSLGIGFVKIDGEQQEDLADEYKIADLPHLVWIRNGKPYTAFTYRTMATLDNMVAWIEYMLDPPVFHTISPGLGHADIERLALSPTKADLNGDERMGDGCAVIYLHFDEKASLALPWRLETVLYGLECLRVRVDRPAQDVRQEYLLENQPAAFIIMNKDAIYTPLTPDTEYIDWKSEDQVQLAIRAAARPAVAPYSVQMLEDIFELGTTRFVLFLVSSSKNCVETFNAFAFQHIVDQHIASFAWIDIHDPRLDYTHEYFGLPQMLDHEKNQACFVRAVPAIPYEGEETPANQVYALHTLSELDQLQVEDVTFDNLQRFIQQLTTDQIQPLIDYDDSSAMDADYYEEDFYQENEILVRENDNERERDEL